MDNGNLLHSLPESVVILVFTYIDTRAACALTQTDKKLKKISQDHEEFICRARVQAQFGSNLLPPSSLTWKEWNQKLYFGHGIYTGFALDKFTNNYEPYPMVFHHHWTTTHPLAGPTWIHWPTLRNSITRVTTSYARQQHSDLLRCFPFREIEIVQGEDILVPNDYAALHFGPAIVGNYITSQGAFFLCHLQWRTQQICHLQQGQSFAGVIIVIDQMDQTGCIDYSYDQSPILEIKVKDEILKQRSVHYKDIDMHVEEVMEAVFEGEFKVQSLSHFNIDWVVSCRIIKLKPYKSSHGYDLKFHFGHSSGPPPEHTKIRSLVGASGYGWLKGNYILGFTKNETFELGVTCSFIVELKQGERINMLGIRHFMER